MTTATNQPASLADAVDVWLLEPSRWDGPEERSRCEALLSPHERAHAARLQVLEVRRTYVLTRALVRRTLSRYAPVDPTAWGFAPTAHGRPEIAAPAGAPPLRFSVSHTTGLIGCAVARALDLGLDLEDGAGRSPRSPLAIAERFFAPAERAALRALAPAEHAARFFTVWTLKEAYAKARGLGLSLPLDRFAVALDAAGGVRLDVDAELADDATGWQLVALRPTPRHHGALAIRRGAAPDLAVRVAWV